ncbi:TPA: hypothetical protein HA239_02015 [Candidatus Woesearchaeota archaeon]|nr:hypothetical protein QT06_C0001G1005 [archaeon GW2011_AR15]MBS3104521.1 hypothetical protein [Candidatus Woesearchaeota archaeon]HIH41165.1 hypothetical protein [Candidatus Woesearchaeota archaeon]
MEHSIKKLIIIAVILFLVIISLFVYSNKEEIVYLLRNKGNQDTNYTGESREYNQTEIAERLKSLGYLD